MPKVIWCWRCQMELPMLTMAEYEQMNVQARARAKAEGIRIDVATCREYSRITGFDETNINAILHHIVELRGPPCKACGKPLRTPVAKLCAACMNPVS